MYIDRDQIFKNLISWGDEGWGHFGDELSDELLEKTKKYYYLKSIEFFWWDNIPQLHVFMIEDGTKNYLEINVKVDDLRNGSYFPYFEKWDYSTHGFPCISKTIYVYEE